MGSQKGYFSWDFNTFLYEKCMNMRSALQKNKNKTLDFLFFESFQQT